MASSPHEKATEVSPPHDDDVEFNASSISLEKDVALGLVGEHARDIDPQVEARVVRKIDWFLIPAMIVGMHKTRIPSRCTFRWFD
jgi:hypothetical protein